MALSVIRVWLGVAVSLLLTAGSGSPVQQGLRIILDTKTRDIDVAEGSPRQEPRQIGAFVVDSRNNVITLDPNASQIHAFDSEGHALSASNLRGGDSRELASAQALALDDRDRVYALEGHSHRVTRYELRRSGFTLTAQYTIPFEGNGMCIVGPHLFLLGLYEGMLVHQFTLDGKYVTSFAKPPGSAGPIVRTSIASGYLACIPTRRMVVMASRILPDVVAFDTDGRPLWSRRLSGVRQQIIEDHGGHGVTLRIPEAGYELITSLFTLSASIGVVQAKTVPGTSLALGITHRANIQTFFISLTDGTEAGKQASLPPLTTAKPPYIYSVSNLPVSRISIFRYHVFQEP